MIAPDSLYRAGRDAADPKADLLFISCTALRAAGCDFSHVVEMTSYHIGLQAQLEAFKTVKDEFIPEPYPAWTAIGVSELAVPGTVVEIRVIARCRSARK